MLRKKSRLLVLRSVVFLGIFIAISAGAHAQKNPPIPNVILSEPIENVTDSLVSAVAGATDTHKVGFTTTASPLSDSATIWITFPDGFDISGISDVVYTDNDPSNDGNQPSVSSWDSLGQTLKCYLASGDQPAAAGFRVSLEISDITNSTIANNYTVNLFASDSLDNVTHGPAASSPFAIVPDTLDHIVFVPGTDTSVAAGSAIVFAVGGYDQYDNHITGLVFSYAVTVDSCGDVSNGVFTANKLGDCYVTASSGGVTDSSGIITVTPGPFGRYAVTGTPAQRTAGISFTNPVVVTVYDIRDNIKSDFTGNIWFESNDGQAVLPYDSGSPFNFPVDSSGVAAFAGGGFTLKTAGSRVISVTDGTNSASSSPIIVQAASIASFVLSAGQNQTAGQSFQLNVPYPTAVDSFGNYASGTIIVSTSYGGGSSPGGIPPLLSPIAVSNGSGSANQTLTNAVRTVLQGSASGYVATTDTISVAPGIMNEFDMTGYPSRVTAGDSFPGDVTVTAYDPFGNIKTNYADTVYFESIDTLAVLPPGHRFVPADSGIHIFSGSQFSLRSAGEQTITVSNGPISKISNIIEVDPDILASFALAAPGFVSSGVPFVLTVSSGRDQWGNLANGVVAVDDSIGGGNSPDGTPPVLNAIQVTNGAGSSNQTLVNTDTTVLSGTSGSAVAVTGDIVVLPGNLGELDLTISSPQYNDSVFSGTATLTALDGYGNVKTNFNASADTIVITSSAGGTMQNSILKLPGDFAGGVADLIAKQTSYSGRGGLMTFGASSQSGVTGISGPVMMRAIACEDINLVQAIVSWEDTVTGSIAVANDGDVGVNITNLDILTEDSLLFNPLTVSPGFPAPIGAGQQQIFDISFIIPGSTPLGMHAFSAAAFGNFTGVPVSDTLDSFPDTLRVESESNVTYVAGSISRDTLSSGSWYSLSLRLSNSGGAGIALYDSSNIYFSDGTHQFRADISSGVFIPPNPPQGIMIILDSAYVDAGFNVGAYQPVLNFYGEENGNFLSGAINLSDSIIIETGPVLQYTQGSITVDSLVQGQNASFAVHISNSGDASFYISHQDSKISFSDSNREFVAFSDTSAGVRVDILLPGTDTLFSFTPTILIPEFAPGIYLPTVTLRGTQNGLEETRQFSTDPDSITVLTRGALRIDSTYAMSRNVPFVNTAQACSVKVVISNLGLEPVQSFYATLESDGNLDSAAISNISGGGTAAAVFSFNADSDPDSAKIYTSALTGGTGSVSGIPPQILQPVDNTALFIIETPALLALAPLSVVSPSGAMDDTVAVDQVVTLSTSVSNSGMADIEGAQRLTLDVGSSGFALLDSANRDYILDDDVFWDVRAPGSGSVAALLSIRFLNRPLDSNNGRDAVGPDSVSSRTFVVSTTPEIQHVAVISAPNGAIDNILSTDQLFTVSDTITALGIFENLTASITLPTGFSTTDPLTQNPIGGLASWAIRAPDNPVVDSISVAAQLMDPNTGAIVSTGTDYIFMDIVEKARLNLQTAIIGPRAALDGIIEPGASLQYQAVVRNLGQASAGEGVISLHPGNPDMQVAEDTTQTFNPDVPLVWNITVPDSEVLAPIAIWAGIDFMPFDENTDSPAFVLTDSSGINITVRELLPELVVEPVGIYRGSVVKGQQLDYFVFNVRNRDRGGSFSVRIDGISFLSQINPQGQPADVFSSISLLADSLSYQPDNISGDTVGFVFGNDLILEPGQSVEFTFRLVVSSQTEISDFRFFLDSDNITGSVLEGGMPTVPLAGVSARGEQEIIAGNPAALLASDFLNSISVYPNPFNPREGPARIDYNLDTDSDLEVRIFTLVGEPVWFQSIAASEPLGMAGVHTYDTAVMWDGKNDAGREVRSGVYICLFKNNSSGEEEKFKIAVVK